MCWLFGVPEEAGTIGLPLDKVIASSDLSSKLKEVLKTPL
jgi:hypothetical protein